MEQIIETITVYDKDRRKGFTIDFVKKGQTIKPDGKRVGHYRAVVDVLEEGDLRL